jgi:hypothetical protein
VVTNDIPALSGIQVMEQLPGGPSRKTIPILIHTGAMLTAEERRPTGHVESITSKRSVSLLPELELIGALGDDLAETGANLGPATK